MKWFVPPYNVNVETNIGKAFPKLIDKHFPKTSKFHKIYNKNNVKISNSSCLKRQPKDNLNIFVDIMILARWKDIA